jgi:hypothetical protein
MISDFTMRGQLQEIRSGSLKICYTGSAKGICAHNFALKKAFSCYPIIRAAAIS